MARLTDEQFEQADKMVRELYDFLTKHGDDNDEFFEVYPALDNYICHQRNRNGRASSQ